MMVPGDRSASSHIAGNGYWHPGEVYTCPKTPCAEAYSATGNRSHRKAQPDMTGSAYCLDCGVRAVHERGPGTPLVIRHKANCPNSRQENAS